jgi:hypothetical protein
MQSLGPDTRIDLTKDVSAADRRYSYGAVERKRLVSFEGLIFGYSLTESCRFFKSESVLCSHRRIALYDFLERLEPNNGLLVLNLSDGRPKMCRRLIVSSPPQTRGFAAGTLKTRRPGTSEAEGIWTQQFGRQNNQRAGCLFLPAFRRITAARDLAGLVEPLAIHLDPCGVFLSLSRHLHRIAHLLLPVLGENDLRGGRVPTHDDQRILDRHVESSPFARGRRSDSRCRSNPWGRASRRRRGDTVICLLDAFPALVVPRAENQLAVFDIKAFFALPVHFAKVVVVTRNLIQDQLAVNQ